MTDSAKETDRACRRAGCEHPEEFPGGPADTCVLHCLEDWHREQTLYGMAGGLEA
jgi:hypothetical protein